MELRLALVLTLVLCAARTGLSDPDPEFLKQGDAAIRSGLFTEAVRHYTSAIEASASPSVPLTKRAQAYTQMKEYRKAISDLDKAIEEDPTGISGLIARGRLNRQLCYLEPAETDFNRILELRGTQKTATEELELISKIKPVLSSAQEYLDSNQFEHALQGVEAALDLAGTACKQALEIQATASLYLGRYEAAVNSAGKYLKIKSDDLHILWVRGVSYYKMGDVDTAKAHYQQGLKYDPENKKLKDEYRLLKKLEKKMKSAFEKLEGQQYAEAVETFQEAMEVDPSHVHTQYTMLIGLCKAMYLGKVGEEEKRLEVCVKAEENSEGDDKLQLVLYQGEIMLTLEKYEEAVRTFNRAREINPRSHQVNEAINRADRLLKRSKQKDYYKILGIPKTSSASQIKKAYRELAKVYHPDRNQGNIEEAETKMQEVNEAYEVLSDEELRAKYDRGEDLNPQGGGGGGPQHNFFRQGGGFGQGFGGGRFSFRFG